LLHDTFLLLAAVDESLYPLTLSILVLSFP